MFLSKRLIVYINQYKYKKIIKIAIAKRPHLSRSADWRSFPVPALAQGKQFRTRKPEGAQVIVKSCIIKEYIFNKNLHRLRVIIDLYCIVEFA